MPRICNSRSRDSSVGIATRYGLEGPGIESRWGEIFRTYPDRLRGAPSFLYNRYRIFPGGIGGRGVKLTTHSLLVPRLTKSWAIPPLTLWVLLGLLRGSLYLIICNSKPKNKRWDEIDIIKKKNKHSRRYEMDDQSLWVMFPAGIIEVSFSTNFRLVLWFTELPVQLILGYHLRRYSEQSVKFTNHLQAVTKLDMRAVSELHHATSWPAY
jgi:hypothetical protein